MITVEKGVILSPTNLDFENNGVINPGIYQEIQYIIFVPSGTRRK
jgi:hypothetical protein